VTDCTPEDFGWGAALGAVALVRTLEVVKLEESVKRRLQLEPLVEVASAEGNPPCEPLRDCRRLGMRMEAWHDRAGTEPPRVLPRVGCLSPATAIGLATCLMGYPGRTPGIVRSGRKFENVARASRTVCRGKALSKGHPYARRDL
jgi:hypothetical protein